jgi:hypothetical protein
MTYLEFDPYAIRQRNEEAACETQELDLEERLRENRRAKSWWGRFGLALVDALALLGAVGPVNAGRAKRW